MLIAIAALALAAAPAADHQAEVERAVFELCPRAMEGVLSLTEPAQVAVAGYTPAEPRQTPGGPMPRMMRGTGTDRIVISARVEGGQALCSVWFGGPDNRRLADRVRSRAQSAGYSGGDGGRLGDGSRMYIYRLQGSTTPRSLIMIDADAGGELDFEPATTVVLMSGQG
jgi:hypothetical protein